MISWLHTRALVRLAGRLTVALALYALVLQACLATALAAKSAAWGGNPFVICQGDVPHGTAPGVPGDPLHNGDCALACWVAVTAAMPAGAAPKLPLPTVIVAVEPPPPVLAAAVTVTATAWQARGPPRRG